MAKRKQQLVHTVAPGCEFRVRCERDNTTFDTISRPYPTAAKQMTEYDSAGDRFIECPTCGRRYFHHDDREDNEPEARGKWYSDRPLTILASCEPTRDSLHPEGL